MLEIIKERTPETLVDRYLEFSYKDDPNAGFMFPALENGEPDFDHMPAQAKANYESCLTNDRLNGPEFMVNKRTYIHPAIGKCSCGREVTLDCDYIGAVRCECGKWYNLFGQSLVDPKYWHDDL